MELTGKVHDISIEYRSRKPVLSLVLDQDPVGIDDLMDALLSIKIGKYRKHRSLDSNAYFHKLCDELRKKLGISFASCKNQLITSYGQIMYLDDGFPFIYKTNAPPEYMRELETIHMSLIKIGDDGAFWYKGYRGSHEYDSAEMSLLIQGTIAECKLQGIETATPDEIARMQEAWERYRNER